MRPISFEALEGLTGRLAALGLFHAIWIGLLAAAFTAIVFQTLHGLSHQGRHGLLLGAIGVVMVGPVVAVSIQRSMVAASSSPTSVSIRVETTQTPTGPTKFLEVTERPPDSKPTRSMEVSIRFERILNATISRLETLQPFVLAAWLFGVGFLSARLFLAGFAIRQLVRSSKAAATAIEARAHDLARRLKLRRIPTVLVHPGLNEPGLCGLFSPTILLPGPWLNAADPGRIDAILAHELAHAKRIDLPANLVQRLVETAFFFHPAIYWLSRSLRRERELCADALAITLTGDPISLASALESVARFRLASLSSCRRAPSFGASLGGENVSLLPRIQELLGMTPNRPTRRSLWPLASLPVAGLVALLSASLGLANDPPKSVGPEAKSGVDASSVSATTPKRANVYGPPGTATKPVPAAGTDPFAEAQISYEIRFLSIASTAWRDSVKDGLREVHREGRLSAWILRDPNAIRDLLTSLQSDPKSNVLQAPKVTSFEGARARIFPGPKRNLIAELQKLQPKDSQASLPIARSIEMGSQVDVNGRIQRGSVLMTVDLFDTSLTPTYDRKTHTSLDSFLFTSHSRLSKVVPEGASLLISQGRQEGRPESPPVVGLPTGKAERVTLERLVLITPKVIQLEVEEKQIKSSLQDPKTRTASGQSSSVRKPSYSDFAASAMY